MLTKILTKMKKVIKICAAVVAVAAITGISYWSNATRNSDVNLSELVEISDADAECVRFFAAHGRCLPLSGVCVFDTELEQCDPYHWD